MDSFLKHRDITAYPDDELNFIQDDATASSVLAKKIAYHSDSKARIQFQTFLNAVDCELRDLCYVDHDFLPQETRKRHTDGIIYGPISVDDTSIAIEVSTDLVIGDIIIIDDEVMKVKGLSESFGTGGFDETRFSTGTTNSLLVTRGFAGSVTATHVSLSVIYKLTTKWEILSISINPQQVNMYALSLREV